MLKSLCHMYPVTAKCKYGAEFLVEKCKLTLHITPDPEKVARMPFAVQRRGRDIKIRTRAWEVR